MKQLTHCLSLFNRIALMLLLMTWGPVWAQTQPVLPLAPPILSSVPNNGDVNPIYALKGVGNTKTSLGSGRLAYQDSVHLGIFWW